MSASFRPLSSISCRSLSVKPASAFLSISSRLIHQSAATGAPVKLPLKDVAADIINRKYILEEEKNSVINQVESGNINNQIIEEYKKRIADEIIRELEVNNYNCIKAFVSVDENTDSEKFGNVLNVVCDMTVKRENKKENSVDSIKVPQIVIDKSGIRIENDTEKEEVDLSDEETIIAEIVANVTGVDKSRILIRWSDLK